MTEIQFLLTKLQEECAEVAHRAAKASCFGMEERQIDGPFAYAPSPDREKTNAHRLWEEWCDLVAIMEMIKEKGWFISREFSTHSDCQRICTKTAKIEAQMAYARTLGTLSKTDPENESGNDPV